MDNGRRLGHCFRFFLGMSAFGVLSGRHPMIASEPLDGALHPFGKTVIRRFQTGEQCIAADGR